jgi:hypothetical protein
MVDVTVQILKGKDGAFLQLEYLNKLTVTVTVTYTRIKLLLIRLKTIRNIYISSIRKAFRKQTHKFRYLSWDKLPG